MAETDRTKGPTTTKYTYTLPDYEITLENRKVIHEAVLKICDEKLYTLISAFSIESSSVLLTNEVAIERMTNQLKESL